MPMIPSGTPIHLFEDTLICIERAMLVWRCFKHCSLLLLRQRKTKSLFQEWRTNSTSNWNMAWSGVICPWLKAWTKSWNCCAVGTRSKVNLSTGAIKHCGSPKVAGGQGATHDSPQTKEQHKIVYPRYEWPQCHDITFCVLAHHLHLRTHLTIVPILLWTTFFSCQSNLS